MRSNTEVCFSQMFSILSPALHSLSPISSNMESSSFIPHPSLPLSSVATFCSHHARVYYETAEVIFRWRVSGMLCQTDVHHWEGNGPRQRKGTCARESMWHSKKLIQNVLFFVQNLMEKYFNRVSHIIEARKIDSRVRFMLQDLVDLRQVREL